MSRNKKLPLTQLIDERIKRGRKTILGTVVPFEDLQHLQQLSLSPKTGAHTYVAHVRLNAEYSQANRDDVGQFPIIKNVPIAVNTRDVGYVAFRDMPVILAKSETGKLEIIATTKRGRAVQSRKATVSVVSGIIISEVNLGIIITPIPYGDFPLAGGYGIVPYGANAIYDLNGNFIELVT